MIALKFYALFVFIVVLANVIKPREDRLTWVGLLNVLVLQWFFVRLARVMDTETGKQTGLVWLKWIVPVTGWWGPFIHVRTRRAA